MESRPPRRRGAVAALSIAAASVALHLLIVAGLARQDGPRMPERAAVAPRVVDATLLRPPPPPPPPPPPAAPRAPVSRAPEAMPAPRTPAAPARPKPPPAARPSSATKSATVREPTALAAGAVASAATAPAPPDPTDFGAAPVPVELADAMAVDAGAADAVPSAVASAGGTDGAPDAAGTGPPGPVAGDADVGRAPLPPLPGAHSRRFRVYWGEFTEGRAVARLQYRLEIDGSRYEIRTEAEAEGLISLVYSGTLTQLSRGRHGTDGLEPLRYAEQRGKRAERSVAFDPDARLLLPAGRPPVPLPRGTQDRLSVFYQLGLLARADPAAFSAGSAPVVPVASLREVEMQRFEVVGDEILMAPGGPLRTLHLRRPAPSGSGDPEIDVWLGYDFEMLPVRLRIRDSDSRVLDQLIEREG